MLKAKNRLSAEDAKLVEEALAARMALQGASSDALATDEPASAPIDPSPFQPPLASRDAVKRPKGRPRKLNAAAEQVAASPVPPKPTIDDNPAPPSTHLQADAAPAKIGKASLRSASRVAIATRNRTQGKRRIHSPPVQNPLPRQPQLRRRSLVGETSH
jgi:hypothetical protein